MDRIEVNVQTGEVTYITEEVPVTTEETTPQSDTPTEV